jgi:hypothetical protein
MWARHQDKLVDWQSAMVTQTHVEAGDKKVTTFPRLYLFHPLPMGRGTWPSRLEESQMRRWDVIMSSAGLGPESGMELIDYITDQFSRQGGRPTTWRPQIPDGNQNLIMAPDEYLTPKKTGRLTNGSNIILNVFQHFFYCCVCGSLCCVKQIIL